ncbi:MAG: hypothetical protein ABGY43_02790 [bacterium]|jgi:hypothetical protein|nr:hypothetical protein [Gammaproteobacteria bacterium]HIL82292.1 hypothetical protein [Pseudomonadales bacterium]
MLRDPLVRRFISSSVFAGAFVWVAVRYFEVDTEVVWVLFGLSFVFVGTLIVVGLVLAPAVRLFRRKPSLLSKLDDLPDELSKPPAQKES